MKISVVIPCHNAAPWIDQALASVYAQTLAPYEVIVVDDGSTDDSVQRIEASVCPVRLLKVNCRNAAAARNAGLETATGDWIALLDADDAWYPNHLQRAAEVLAGTDDVAYRALCDDMTVDGTLRPVTKPQPIKTTRTRLTHAEYIRFENQELYFGHSSCVIRRDRLAAIGGYNAEQVRRHDIDMWLRLIHNHTWSWDSVPTVAYRIDTPGSIGRSYAECEYYYLQALARNEAAYPGPDMRALLAKAARKVMTLAFVGGAFADAERARRLAWRYLPFRVRLAYTCAARAPVLARLLIRAKRRLFTWRTGHRMPVAPAPTNGAPR